MSDRPDGPGEPSSSETSQKAGPSLTELVPVILQSVVALLAGKVRLAEREISRNLASIRAAAWLIAVSVVLFVLALGLASVGAALLLGRWLESPAGGWLLIAVVYLVVGLVALAVARSRMKNLSGLLRETRADLKRDAEWLKDLS